MIENTKEIVSYLHCRLCAEEFIHHEHVGKSPQTLQNLEIGWTKRGVQVWCKRHDVNIVHIDFEGTKHPANTSMIPPEMERKT